MAPRRIPATSQARLMEHLFGVAAPADANTTNDPFAAEFAAWLASLPRFRAFVDAHRDKIRKKLRLATDLDARKDVRAELRIARLVLADRNIELAYEPGGVAEGGPDFSVTYRRGRPFNLEVTRPRWRSFMAQGSRPILAKLRQLPAGVPNVLVLVLPADGAHDWDVREVIRDLRARADAKEESFFVRRRFGGTRDFYERFLRLSAVAMHAEGIATGSTTNSWINPSARIAVPDAALRACLEALRGL